MNLCPCNIREDWGWHNIQDILHGRHHGLACPEKLNSILQAAAEAGSSAAAGQCTGPHNRGGGQAF